MSSDCGLYIFSPLISIVGNFHTTLRISWLVDYVPLGDHIFNRAQYRPNDRLSGNHHSIVARIPLIGFWEVLKRI